MHCNTRKQKQCYETVLSDQQQNQTHTKEPIQDQISDGNHIASSSPSHPPQSSLYQIPLSTIKSATAASPDPPSKPVGNITSITMRSDPTLQTPSLSHRSRVINPCRRIKCHGILGTTPTRLVDSLRQPVARSSPGCAFSDHLCDDARGTGCLDLSGIV